jgi:hypothetical protein
MGGRFGWGGRSLYVAEHYMAELTRYTVRAARSRDAGCGVAATLSVPQAVFAENGWIHKRQVSASQYRGQTTNMLRAYQANQQKRVGLRVKSKPRLQQPKDWSAIGVVQPSYAARGIVPIARIVSRVVRYG